MTPAPAPAGDVPAMEWHNVSVSYHDRPVLRGVTLAIAAGRVTGVIGPNGAGKSTLLKAALGLVPLDSGRVRLFGRPALTQRRRVAYVPQRGAVDWDYPVSVADVVLMGRYPHLGLARRPGPADLARVRRALEETGLDDLANRQIGQLSGGQQQRVFLARALAQEADLLLLDEPFVGVDAATEEAIIGLIRRLKDQGRTVLLVNHDLTVVREYYDDLVMLNQRVVAVGPAGQVFTEDTLRRTFGGRLTILEQADLLAKEPGP